MSETGQAIASAGPVRRRGSSEIPAWLVGRPDGRWGRMALTAVLLVTALSAWAAALIQPWARRHGDPGLLAVGGATLEADRLRAAGEDVERLWAQFDASPPRALRRDPFTAGPAADAAAAPAEAGGPGREAAETGPAAQAMLETLKDLRLKATLVDPEGKRWAVVNGHDCTVGDRVEGVEIVEILEGRIKVRKAGIVCCLRMD